MADASAEARPPQQRTASLPARVRGLILAYENDSERLIGWVQLGLVGFFALLFFIAPRPKDAMGLEPVPIALAAYLLLTTIRLYLSYRITLPRFFVVLSIVADVALLWGLVWWFHVQYGQSAPFALKVPMFIYVFVFVALRALRFDPRYVLIAGLVAALGWGLLTLWVLSVSPPATITRNFGEYLNGNRILIGAEIEKIVTLLVVAGVLGHAVARARRMLLTAVEEQSAGREIRRFLPVGVADTIRQSDKAIEAGEAAERQAAIMMLDIRGFSAFSTTVSPREVVAMLTSLHRRIVPLIEAGGGIVDKFLGDGVMATFGAVQPSPSAARDALAVLGQVIEEAQAWEREQAHGMSLAVNGAVAAGPIVFAAIGSADRLEYTVIGEAVNLAAKLEKHNKVEGTRALTSQATFELACRQGYVPQGTALPLGSCRVAGVTTPLPLVAMAR
jgi:adenylate cyclase